MAWDFLVVVVWMLEHRFGHSLFLIDVFFVLPERDCVMTKSGGSAEDLPGTKVAYRLATANTRLECTSATTVLWKCPKSHGTTVASRNQRHFLKNRRGGVYIGDLMKNAPPPMRKLAL